MAPRVTGAKPDRSLSDRIYREKNRDKLAVYHRAYYVANAEKSKAKARQRRLANPDAAAEYGREYYKRNSEKLKAKAREYGALHSEEIKAANHLRFFQNRARYYMRTRKWIRDSPIAHKAITAKARTRLRARDKNQLHPLIDPSAVRRLISVRRSAAKSSGQPHELDHIIPLSVGGWHHHGNLQILPKRINAEKGADPFWEHPDYKSWRDVPEELWPEKLAPEYAKRSADKPREKLEHALAA